jgi:toxin ParE1/3/4
MQILYTDDAKQDFQDIVLYGISQQLLNPVGYAAALRARIERFAEIEHPGREGRVAGTREWVLTKTSFIVVYTLRDDAIVVLRVLHGAQQWPPAEE